MQTILESLFTIMLSAIGCGVGAILGLVLHNKISRRKHRKGVKPLELDSKFNEPVKEDSRGNPIVFFSESNYRRWLAKWGFKKNLNMLQLMQYRIDEYQGDLGLLLKESVYARLAAKEYLVTIHGEYVIADANTLTKMEADFYAEKVSPDSHLFAIPKDWVDETLNKHPELVLTDVD